MEELEDKFEELEERVRQLQVDMGVGAAAEAARALRSGDDTDVQVCQRFELRKCGKENRHFSSYICRKWLVTDRNGKVAWKAELVGKCDIFKK